MEVRNKKSSESKEADKSVQKKTSEFFCKLCNLDYFTSTQFEEHDWSLLHHQRMEKHHGRDFVHICSLCHFSCKGLSAYGKHLISQQHRDMLERRRQPQSQDRVEPEPLVFNRDMPRERQSPDFYQMFYSDTGLPNQRRNERQFSRMERDSSYFASDNMRGPDYGPYGDFGHMPFDVWNVSQRDGYNQQQFDNSFTRPQFDTGQFDQHRFFMPVDLDKSYQSSNRIPTTQERRNNPSGRNSPWQRNTSMRTNTPVNDRNHNFQNRQLNNRPSSAQGYHNRSFSKKSYSSYDTYSSGPSPSTAKSPTYQTKQPHHPNLGNHHRKSYSLGAVPTSSLGSRQGTGSETQHSQRSYPKQQQVTQGNSAKISPAEPSDMSSILTTKNNLSTNKNANTAPKSQQSAMSKSFTHRSRDSRPSSSDRQSQNVDRSSRSETKVGDERTAQKLQELKARSEEVRQNIVKLSDLKDRVARGHKARNQQHIDDMDKSLRNVYSKELQKLESPTTQECMEVSEPAMRRSMDQEHRSERRSPVRKPRSSTPHSEKRIEAKQTEMPNRRYSTGKKQSPVVMRGRPHTKDLYDGREHSYGDHYITTGSRDLNMSDFDAAGTIDMGGSYIEIPQKNTVTQSMPEEEYQGPPAQHSNKHKPQKQRNYSRSDSFPPYPQVSYKGNPDQNSETTNDSGDAETQNTSKTQYCRSQSSELPRDESSKDDQQAVGIDVSKLNLPTSLQKELSKHIAASNIAKSDKTTQPNLGQARSRLHVGQKPQNIESQDVAIQQRLLQMMSSPQSRHRQEKQFEILKQHVQAKKTVSKLPRFGLQLLPSHMSLSQLVRDTRDSQDDIDTSQSESIHMSDMEERVPSPSSSVGGKRPHSVIDATNSVENTTVDADNQNKRRRVKQEVTVPSEPVVEEEENETGDRVDLNVLYQMSVTEESLLSNLATLDSNIAEIKEFLQKKMEDLKAVEVERDKVSEAVQKLRSERMNILKGAVAERRPRGKPSASASRPPSDEPSQSSSNDVGKLESKTTAQDDGVEITQYTIVKTEPIDTGYEATNQANSSQPIFAKPQTPPTNVGETVQSTAKPVQKKVLNQPMSETTESKTTQKQTRVLIQHGNRVKNEENTEVIKPDTVNDPVANNIGVECEPVSVSEEEVAPHLRSLEALQNSASFNVSSINTGSNALQQLANNFLELKSASMLFLRETDAEKAKDDIDVSQVDSVEDMEIGTDTDVSMQTMTPVQSSQAAEGSARNTQHSPKVGTMKMSSPGKKKTQRGGAVSNQAGYNSPFQSVIESIMEESDDMGLSELQRQRSTQTEQESKDVPKEEESPAWVAPLSKDVKDVLRNMYKNPYSKKAIGQQRQNEKSTSAHVNIRDYRSSVRSSNKVLATSKHPDLVQSRDQSPTVDNSRDIQRDNSQTTVRDTTKKSKTGSENKQQDVKKVKRKKRRPKNDDVDSETDGSPKQDYEQTKRTSKPKAKKTTHKTLIQDPNVMLAPPVRRERRGRPRKEVNEDEYFLPLVTDSSQQPSTSYKLATHQRSTSDEHSDSDDDQMMEDGEMPSSILGDDDDVISINQSEIKIENTADVLEVLSYEEPMITDEANSSADLPISADVVSSTIELDTPTDEMAHTADSATEEEGTTVTRPSLTKFPMEKLQVSLQIRNRLRKQVLEQKGLTSRGKSDTVDEIVNITPTTSTESRQSSRKGKGQRKTANANLLKETRKANNPPEEVVSRPNVTGLFKGYHQDSITDIDLHCNRLLTSSADGTVKSWDVKTGQVIKLCFQTNGKAINCLRSVRKRMYIGVGNNIIWKNVKKQFQHEFHFSQKVMCFTRAWEKLFTGLADGTVVCGYQKTMHVLGKDIHLTMNEEQVSTLWFLAILRNNNRTFHIFNCSSPRAVSCMVASAVKGKKLLLVGSFDANITVHDPFAQETLRTLTGHTKTVLCLKVLDELVFSGSADTSVLAHNINTGEEEGRYEGHDGSVTGICIFKSNTDHIVTSSLDKFVRLFNIKDQTCVRKVGGFPSMIMCIEAHMHHLLVYAGCRDGSLYALPFDVENDFSCHWKNCDLSFTIKAHLLDHLQIDHAEGDEDSTVFRCHWKQCRKQISWKKHDSSCDVMKEIQNHLCRHVGPEK